MSNSRQILTQQVQELADELEAFKQRSQQQIDQIYTELKQELAEIRKDIEAVKEGWTSANEREEETGE